MDPKSLAAQIASDLETLPQRTTHPMRAVRRGYSKRLRPEDAGHVLAVAHAILESGKHPWIAYELIHDHPGAFQSLDEQSLEALGRGMNNWGTVDSFARTLSGPAWRDGLIPDRVIHAWAGSDDRWWRRAALVSTVALNIRSHGGKGDARRTLAVCEGLKADRDDMVVKALSWALRALIVHDPAVVENFLSKHDRVLHARVRREVQNKLRTGLKNP